MALRLRPLGLEGGRGAAGYNHSIRYKNYLVHIQTEDAGARQAAVFTHVFIDGRVIGTRRASYAEHLGTADLDAFVRRLIYEQHRATFVALRGGEFDGALEQTPQVDRTSGVVRRAETIAHALSTSPPAAPSAAPAAPPAPPEAGLRIITPLRGPPRPREPRVPARDASGDPASPSGLGPRLPTTEPPSPARRLPTIAPRYPGPYVPTLAPPLPTAPPGSPATLTPGTPRAPSTAPPDHRPASAAPPDHRPASAAPPGPRLPSAAPPGPRLPSAAPPGPRLPPAAPPGPRLPSIYPPDSRALSAEQLSALALVASGIASASSAPPSLGHRPSSLPPALGLRSLLTTLPALEPPAAPAPTSARPSARPPAPLAPLGSPATGPSYPPSARARTLSERPLAPLPPALRALEGYRAAGIVDLTSGKLLVSDGLVGAAALVASLRELVAGHNRALAALAIEDGAGEYLLLGGDSCLLLRALPSRPGAYVYVACDRALHELGEARDALAAAVDELD